jgi:hypothetical protein
LGVAPVQRYQVRVLVVSGAVAIGRHGPRSGYRAVPGPPGYARGSPVLPLLGDSWRGYRLVLRRRSHYPAGRSEPPRTRIRVAQTLLSNTYCAKAHFRRSLQRDLPW